MRDMHKHKRHHHGHHGGWGFGGWFWMIGLWYLFSSGHGIWPGILILVGISMLLGSFFREEERPPKVPDIPFPLPVDPFKPHRRPTPETVPVAKATPTPPAEPVHNADLLPATCAHCGGPVRSYEVKWTGKQSAACTYCGSNLQMKKAH
jgi:DNA-directed RNA polymerase subunit RPC12/RpoP